MVVDKYAVPNYKAQPILEPLICRDIGLLEELWASVLSNLKFSKIKMWIRSNF